MNPSWSTFEDEIGGWFAPENRAILAQLIVEHRIKTVIEIGSFLGLSASWFVRRVEHVTCVDTWLETAEEATSNNLVLPLRRFGIPNDFYFVFKRNMEDLRLWSKITPVRGKSSEVHHEVDEADLVYIDGDHSQEGCASDIELYGRKARKIVCGDDYEERDGWGVREAVDAAFPDRQVSGRFWWAVK